MDWKGIETDWSRFKVLVRHRWSKIDEAQIDAIAGRRDRLLNTIEEEYGITRGESEGQLEAWQDAQG